MEKEKKTLLEDDVLDSVTGGRGTATDFIYKTTCPICNQTVKTTIPGAYAAHIHSCHKEIPENEVWDYVEKMCLTALPCRSDEI